MTRDTYNAEIELVRSSLAALDGEHWKEYLAAWQPTP